MTRVIYSLYIDIPEDRLDDQPAYNGDTISKSARTKIELQANYQKLIDTKVRYASTTNSTFLMYERDDSYIKYYNWFRQHYPEVTEYNVINFYKIKILCDLAEHYDEILYLDFDVVPITNENFFEVWDLSKGIAVATNNDKVRRVKFADVHSCNRSPTAKYYNSMAMLIDQDYNYENDVFNTGIIGASSEHIKQLGYFDNFEDTLDIMKRLQQYGESMFPDNIVDIFGYDNETVWSYKVKSTNTPIQWLNEDWHFFFDREYIKKNSKFIHAINKNFTKIWNYCEENSIQYL